MIACEDTMGMRNANYKEAPDASNKKKSNQYTLSTPFSKNKGRPTHCTQQISYEHD